MPTWGGSLSAGGPEPQPGDRRAPPASERENPIQYRSQRAMPLGTTEVRALVDGPVSIAEGLCRIAEEQYSAKQTHLEEPPNANPAIGAPSFIVVGVFDDPDAAKGFERQARRHNVGGIWRRFTRDAVLSWRGVYVNVYFDDGTGTGGGVAMHGTMEQISDDTIRLMPRAKSHGTDLGPATYGSARASEIPIQAIIEITPWDILE